MVKRVSDTESEILASGEATLSQIAQLFETDPKKLAPKLKGIVPRGRRNGYKVYNIAEAATRLVKPGFEIEDFIRRMSAHELDPLMLKEFWNGQNARTKFERERGDLWETGDVVEAIGTLANGVRMTLLLIGDDIEREVGVTDAQRKIFQRTIDSAIETMNEKITELFKDYEAPSERAQRERESLGIEGDDEGRVLATEDDEEVDI